jgi:hypothetical protein
MDNFGVGMIIGDYEWGRAAQPASCQYKATEHQGAAEK